METLIGFLIVSGVILIGVIYGCLRLAGHAIGSGLRAGGRNWEQGRHDANGQGDNDDRIRNIR